MAGKKTKTNGSTDANGVPAAAGANAPATGTKLRWTSLKAADGVAHRTRQPKAKKTGTTKAATSKTQEDATRTKKLSALDAAAKVLQEAGQPMNCQQMIQAMADKGYWTSPAGKTPAATLYSAIMRETKTKGSQARFQKTARGHFVYQTPQAS
jgi:HB1/ASXL restriction endonuclease-like protein with HTH domain